MAGEQNTFGIPVMYKWCTSSARYFTDGDSECKRLMDEAFWVIENEKRPIIPVRKIAQGRSRMKELAPQLFTHLTNKLIRFSYPYVKWDYNS